MLRTATAALAWLGLFGVALAQQVGTAQPESHPAVATQHCTKAAGCAREDGQITMDFSWRWLHNVGGYKNCLNGASWDPEFCPDPQTCAHNCATEGLDVQKYASTYGVSQIDDGVELKYNPGSRLYLMDSDETYKVFKLLNREFTFDVDVSSLPCGTNAAVYFVEMEADGGGRGANNNAGAKYGTGYCDAQCPRGMKFIDGEANMMDWGTKKAKTPEGKWKEIGPEGRYGACCAEMDIFEANREAAAYTAHPCTITGAKKCEGKKDCGDKEAGEPGVCDKDGCGFNSYRMGMPDFYGPGSAFAVDTTRPMTLVTQFLTSDGTDDGDLSEIRRFWVQDGRLILNSEATAIGSGPWGASRSSITDEFCSAATKAFSNHSDHSQDSFTANGGLKTMGQALGRGMVLAISVWDDGLSRMLWLDGEKTTRHQNTTLPGVRRGPCSFDTGHVKETRKEHPDASVKYTNFRYGEIGSTFHAVAPPTTTATSLTTTTATTATTTTATTTSATTTSATTTSATTTTATTPPPTTSTSRTSTSTTMATTTKAMTTKVTTTTHSTTSPEVNSTKGTIAEATTTEATATETTTTEADIAEARTTQATTSKASTTAAATSTDAVTTDATTEKVVTTPEATSSTKESAATTIAKSTTTTTPEAIPLSTTEVHGHKAAKQQHSCAAYGCGQDYSTSNQCQCNDGCLHFKDCCDDFLSTCGASTNATQIAKTSPVPKTTLTKTSSTSSVTETTTASAESCAAYGCTEYMPSHACQCNPACIEHSSCCEDYADRCLETTSTGSSKTTSRASSTSSTSSSSVSSTTSAAAQRAKEKAEEQEQDDEQADKADKADKAEESAGVRHHYCCTAAPDKNDMCGTCWGTAKLGRATFCGASKGNCMSCHGAWCGTSEPLASVVVRKDDAVALPRGGSPLRGSGGVSSASWRSLLMVAASRVMLPGLVTGVLAALAAVAAFIVAGRRARLSTAYRRLAGQERAAEAAAVLVLQATA